MKNEALFQKIFSKRSRLSKRLINGECQEPTQSNVQKRIKTIINCSRI